MVNKKAKTYAEEFSQFSPQKMPVDMDEEDPEEDSGINAPVPNSEALYGKKIEYLQSNPIKLTDSKVGMDQMFEKKSE